MLFLLSQNFETMEKTLKPFKLYIYPCFKRYERPCFYHISQASASASNSNEAKRYLTVDETGKLYSVETDAKNAAQFAIVENSDSEGTKSIIFIDPRGVNSPPRYVAVTANKTLSRFHLLSF